MYDHSARPSLQTARFCSTMPLPICRLSHIRTVKEGTQLGLRAIYQPANLSPIHQNSPVLAPSHSEA